VARLVDARTRFLRKPFTVEGLIEALAAVTGPTARAQNT
jgi:cell division protein FtsX